MKDQQEEILSLNPWEIEQVEDSSFVDPAFD